MKQSESPLEKVVLQQCLQYLHARNIFAWRQNAGGMEAEHNGIKRFVRFAHQRGVSDIIGMLRDGTFLAVETKREGEEPTAQQAAFLEAVRLNGGVAICVHSVDELIAELEKVQI